MAEPAKTLSDSDFAPASKTLTDADFATGSVTLPAEPIGHKLKRIGKAIVPSLAAGGTVAAGTQIGAELGASVGGPAAPVTAAAGAVIGAGLGGFGAPAMAAAAKQAMGDAGATWTYHDAIKSAIWSAAISVPFEAAGLAAGKYAKYEPELQDLPQGERTLSNLKQIRTQREAQAASAATSQTQEAEQLVRNTDYWKKLGMSDDEIKAMQEHPADAAAWIRQSEDAAREYKDAFTVTKRVGSEDLSKRFEDSYGKYKEAPVDTTPIAATIDKSLETGQRELSPGLKRWLEDKRDEFSGLGKLSKKTREELAQFTPEARAQAMLAFQSGRLALKAEPMTAQGARDAITELNDVLPRTASELDKQVKSTVEDAIEKQFDAAVTKAGGSQEQLAALQATRQSYRVFQTTMRELDPRSEVLGKTVADELFNPAFKNPEYGVKFITLAKAAEEARPGEVMPQLKEAFMQKFIDEVKTASGPEPGAFDELKAIEKIRTQYSKSTGGKLILGEIFGKNSPLADDVTFSKVMSAVDKPEAIALKATSNGQLLNRLTSPGFLGSAYFMLRLGYSAATGKNIMTDINQHPGRVAFGIALAMASGPVIRYALTSGNLPLQRAAVEYMTDPSSGSAVRMAGELVNGTHAALDVPQP